MFEEIACRATSIGELVLRRRRLRPDSEDIWEIKLNDGYLMSSQFVDGEIALTTLALAMLDGEAFDVVVGGMGLGYTAKAALDDARVARLAVVELIPEVIEWHRDHLLPLGAAIAGDARCTMVDGDFFALAQVAGGFDAAHPDRRYDAILVDIDHSTIHLIDPASAGFYQGSAIAAMTAQLRPGGVFALWSSDAEDGAFMAAMKQSLIDVRAERVEFFNPYRDGPGFNIIYLGRRP